MRARHTAASWTIAGDEATVVRYDGTIHDFGLLNALASDVPTRTAIKQMADELKTRTGN